MREKKRVLGFITKAFAIALTLAMLFAVEIPTQAAPANSAVNDAKKGVVQIQVWFSDTESAVEQYLQSGTGFLINDNTVVTCQHVVTAFPDSFYVQWAQETSAALGVQRTAEQVKQGLELRVCVKRDVYVKASVVTASEEMDYAVLSLEKTIGNRKPLEIRNSAELDQTEEVFALGFPGDMAAIESAPDYDVNDVTITSGNVNKIGDMSFSTVEGRVYDHVNCVESSALITGGNSGGPLVDENGYVVGINAAGSDTRNIAVSSQELMDVLDALGIDYTEAGASKPVEPTEPTEVDTEELEELLDEAKEYDKDDFTEDSFADLEDAIENAEDALGSESQDDIDDAVDELKDAIKNLEEAKAEKDDEESGLEQLVIIGIAAAAVVVIVIIILIIVLSKKGKKKQQASVAPQPMPQQPVRPVTPQPMPQQPVRPVAPQAPIPPVMPGSNETSVLNQGSSETTVLSQGAGETSVLSQPVNGGFLTRTSNNERIPVNSADFTIGRERNKVDYCVGGNTNISRIHARFVVRDGKTYIIDNNAANGTFVNGVKARAGQEIEIKSGDKIVLADEKFEFTK